MIALATGPWLDAAARIAARLLASAQWSDGRCTWMVQVPERIPGVRRARAEVASSGIYQGTAGIGLFLLELYRHTREVRLLATAEAALRHAAEAGRRLPTNSFGFHGGRAGIAYALYRLALIARREEALKDAQELLAPLAGNAYRDGAFDVIAGAGGAIPALLTMADRMNPDITLDLAVSLGENLLRRARRGHVGWSWSGMASARDLNGFAHGASGCALALLELASATGDERFRYGAEQAFAYERQFFDPERGNWPDFRHVQLSEYLSYGRTDELRTLLRGGEPIPSKTPEFMSAWCHGAPGIGLARLRAFELVGEPRYAHEARIATATTLRAVGAAGWNFSLCHGHFGNCETLIAATQVLGESEPHRAAEECAADALERYELAGVPWPCGTVNAVVDPSLLIGEAGIGYFFLRLHDATTPSVLCLTPAKAGREGHLGGDVDALRRAYVDEHFGVAIRALQRLQPERPDVLLDAATLPGDSEVMRVREVIRTRIEAEPADSRVLLSDAIAVEDARFALNRTITDFTAEILDDIGRLTVDEVPWQTAVVQLAAHVRLVHTRRDWARWIRSPESPLDVTPEDEPVTTAVFRKGGEARSQSLATFAALVLESATTPGTCVEITRRVVDQVEGATAPGLAAAVLEQLKSAYAAGLLRCLDPPAVPATLVASESTTPAD